MSSQPSATEERVTRDDGGVPIRPSGSSSLGIPGAQLTAPPGERGSGSCRGELHEKTERPLIAMEALIRRRASETSA